MVTSRNFLTDEDIDRLSRIYATADFPEIGYGTVRDYCDSRDVIGDFAHYDRDLKDLQRCWTLKAILANVPRGGRLLEIGAGYPFVADILVRAGYHVTVVDPYDGGANGPDSLPYFRQAMPDITYIQDLFSDRLELPEQSLDAVYSISVLEHIDAAGMEGVGRGLSRFCKPGAPQIHNVDHVLVGFTAASHRESLLRVSSLLGIPDERVDAVMAAAADDTDTYFLSAESFHGWRHGATYAQLPMQKIISVDFCTKLPIGS